MRQGIIQTSRISRSARDTGEGQEGQKLDAVIYKATAESCLEKVYILSWRLSPERPPMPGEGY